MSTLTHKYIETDLKMGALLKEKTWAHALAFIGRLFFSAIFILSSFGHFDAATISAAAAQGVPYPNVLVPLSGLMALLGGMSILVGYRTRIGALLLIAFLVPVTLMMHNFWAISDPLQAQIQSAMFMKNLALLGAALLIFNFGAGPVSLDNPPPTNRG